MKKIIVASGKGGVGKSTVAFLLGKALSEEGRVLLLDFDLCGPSIGVLTNSSNEKVFKGKKGLQPLRYNDTLHFLSISSLVPEDAAIIWRAPKKISLLNMFLESIDEERYEYLVIDMPPGVTDEHMFVIEKIPEGNILLVTTSQNLALDEAVSTLDLFTDNRMHVLGVVENMRAVCCPNCHGENIIFSKNGGTLLAEEKNIPYLGAVEFVPSPEEKIPQAIKNAVVEIKNITNKSDL